MKWSLIVLCAAAVSTAAPSTAADAQVTWFHSPSRNIQCEVSSGAPRGIYASCQSIKPARSVTLKANGSLKTCHGTGCLGNGPENAFTLGYGRSTTVGPFRCTSLRTGMRCIVVRSGRGFLLSRASIARL